MVITHIRPIYTSTYIYIYNIQVGTVRLLRDIRFVVIIITVITIGFLLLLLKAEKEKLRLSFFFIPVLFSVVAIHCHRYCYYYYYYYCQVYHLLVVSCDRFRKTLVLRFGLEAPRVLKT